MRHPASTTISRRLRVSTVALVLSKLTLFSSGTALAEPGSGTAAQALFEQARALMAQGRAAEACPKLEESQRLDPGVGTLLNLARCYEEAGRFASAWNGYLEAASAAHASSNLAREKEARRRAEALRRKLSHLVIVVPESVQRIAGVEVRRDGEIVGQPQWGSPIPSDAGEHVITVNAPGRTEWRGIATVKSGASTTTLTVEAPEPRAEPAPARVAPPTPTPAAGPPTASSAPRPAGLGTQKTLSLVAAGAGLVSLGVGAVFGLESASQHSEAKRYCEGSRCTDQRGVDAGNAAYSAGNVATIFGVLGVAGVAAGAVLWFTAPSATNLQVGLNVGGVDLRGAW